MKRNIRYITLFLAMLLSNTAIAQISPKNEFLGINRSPFDFGNLEPEDIKINFTSNSILESHSIIEKVNERLHRQWVRKQHNIIEEAIENKLGKQFNGIENAMRDVHKNIEARRIKRNINPVVQKYNNKVALKTSIRNTGLNNIKLLEFRKSEIVSGKLDTRYGHLKYKSTPLKDIRSTSAINNLISNEFRDYDKNEALLNFEEHVKDKLQNSLDAINQGAIFNSHILNVAADHQKNYINGHSGSLAKLDLMQIYANNVFVDLSVLSIMSINQQQMRIKQVGTENFIESFGRLYHGQEPSVYDLSKATYDYYYKKYGFATSQILKKLRNELRRNFLDKININDLLTNAAIDGLGRENKEFLKRRPALYKEVKRYLRLHDYSQVSHDCINYLLNQLRNGDNFKPQSSNYIADGSPIKQGPSNLETLLDIKLKSNALNINSGGFKGFGNIFEALFANGEFLAYKGYIIKSILIRNGFLIPPDISDEWFGKAFDFKKSDDSRIHISFVNNNGQFLFNKGITDIMQWSTFVTDLAIKASLNTSEIKGLLFANPKYVFDLKAFIDAKLASPNGLHAFERKFILEVLETIKLHPTKAIIRYNSLTIVGDPCKDIKRHIQQPNIQNQYNELKNKTNLRVENGFAQYKTGPIQVLTHAPGGHAMNLAPIRTRDAEGYTHTHLNDYVLPNGKLANIIRIHSPADLIKFLLIVKTAVNGSTKYVDVISKTGNYTLRFTGDKHHITGLKPKAAYSRIYEGYMTLHKLNFEKGFLHFVKNEIGINGIELYKFSLDGKRIERKKLDANGKVITDNCK